MRNPDAAKVAESQEAWVTAIDLVKIVQSTNDAAELNEAFGELVRRFQGSVYAMALTRVHNPNEAEELAQQVFVHALKKIHQLRDPRCFAGWLRKITARMALNMQTRKGKEVSGFDEESTLFGDAEGREGDPSEAMERAEVNQELYAAMRQMKDLDRETLEAFYLRGRSLKQMAREFEAPVGTIKRRLFVARDRLKAILVQMPSYASYGTDVAEPDDSGPFTQMPQVPALLMDGNDVLDDEFPQDTVLEIPSHVLPATTIFHPPSDDDFLKEEEGVADEQSTLTSELVRKVVTQLSPRQREAVDAIFFRGLSEEAAAAEMGVSRNAVSGHLSFMRQRFKLLWFRENLALIAEQSLEAAHQSA